MKEFLHFTPLFSFNSYFYFFCSLVGPSGDNAEPKQKKLNPYSKIERDEKAKNEILDEETFLDEQEHKTERDWKKTPVWDISYKQQVTASDVFLQVSLLVFYTG